MYVFWQNQGKHSNVSKFWKKQNYHEKVWELILIANVPQWHCYDYSTAGLLWLFHSQTVGTVPQWHCYDVPQQHCRDCSTVALLWLLHSDTVTNFCVIQIIASALFRFWVIESQLSDCSCSHFLSYYKISFSFSWLAIIQILFWNLLSVNCQDFRHKTISETFEQLSKKKPPYFCSLEIIFKYNCKYI